MFNTDALLIIDINLRDGTTVYESVGTVGSTCLDSVLAGLEENLGRGETTLKPEYNEANESEVGCQHQINLIQ